MLVEIKNWVWLLVICKILELKWETTTSYNIGLDFGISIAVYPVHWMVYKRTEDLLVDRAVSIQQGLQMF